MYNTNKNVFTDKNKNWLTNKQKAVISLYLGKMLHSIERYGMDMNTDFYTEATFIHRYSDL